MLLSTLKKNTIVVDRDSGNLYIQYNPLLCWIYMDVLIFDLKHIKCGGDFFWGGGGNIFLAFYTISNISRKNNSGNKQEASRPDSSAV